jgi:restriction system protein
MNPILSALRTLGGSATNQELYEQVTLDMGLTDEQLNLMHDLERGNQSEVGYRMAWARSYLKKVGLIENSRRGVWTLTPNGSHGGDIDPQVVVRTVRAAYNRADQATSHEVNDLSSEPDCTDSSTETTALDGAGPTRGWRERLLQVLRAMPSDAFERLSQRVLRESGFMEVKVTGRSGDGGIDGVGLLRLQDLLSFHVIFQCKRVKDSVSAPQIRDFRGAMVGRADKGLFITTASFTRAALAEATRDGAPAIDLIDGDQLVELLKKLELGVTTEIVERVVVDDSWFESL